MIVEVFRTAKETYQNSAPHNATRYKDLWDALKQAAAPEHRVEPTSDGFSDKVKCSCGWKSEPYWDGMEYAMGDWLEHVAYEMGITARECACGKKYIPADGEKACHRLQEVS